MTRCILIPHDPDYALARTELHSLHDFQMAVGGYLEALPLKEPPISLYCDEDGRQKRLPVNHRATALWWLFEPPVRGQYVIFGDAVLVGGPNEAGDDVDIPDDLATFMLETKKYKVQVSSSDDEWLEAPPRFDDYFRAALFAMRVLERTRYRVDVRVVAA